MVTTPHPPPPTQTETALPSRQSRCEWLERFSARGTARRWHLSAVQRSILHLRSPEPPRRTCARACYGACVGYARAAWPTWWSCARHQSQTRCTRARAKARLQARTLAGTDARRHGCAQTGTGTHAGTAPHRTARRGAAHRSTSPAPAHAPGGTAPRRHLISHGMARHGGTARRRGAARRGAARRPACRHARRHAP